MIGGDLFVPSPLTTVLLGPRATSGHRHLHPRRADHRRHGYRRRLHRRHGRRRRRLPAQRHQQNLPVHRRRQHLDQHLHWPQLPGPGRTSCPAYFACMFPDTGGYWRHRAGVSLPPSTASFTSSMPSTAPAGDPGDVYYIRSTDRGVTFGAPFKLNTDTTTRPQWQPNLSVSAAGTLFAMWYDERARAPAASKGNPAVPCYQMWARKSIDNGVTWLADDTFSDVVTPLPANLTQASSRICGRLRLRLLGAQQARHFMGGRARGHRRPIPAGCLHR